MYNNTTKTLKRNKHTFKQPLLLQKHNVTVARRFRLVRDAPQGQTRECHAMTSWISPKSIKYHVTVMTFSLRK